MKGSECQFLIMDHCCWHLVEMNPIRTKRISAKVFVPFFYLFLSLSISSLFSSQHCFSSALCYVRSQMCWLAAWTWCQHTGMHLLLSGGGGASLYLIDRWWVRPLTVECVQKARRKAARGREGDYDWVSVPTEQLGVRLIGCLSLHWTVISQGAPLWKPFKCELIDVIVLKMTELLW